MLFPKSGTFANSGSVESRFADIKKANGLLSRSAIQYPPDLGFPTTNSFRPLIFFKGGKYQPSDFEQALRVELNSKPSAKKMLLAEQFEALVFLTEADPQLANQTLNKIEKPDLRHMLREAVLSGLVGSGMSHQDALDYIDAKK